MAIRGLTKKQETGFQNVWRDTRPMSVRVVEGAANAQIALYVLVGMGMGVILFPGLADIVVICGGVYHLWLRSRVFRLPFRIPKSSGLKDPSERDFRGRPKAAEGIIYLGVDRETGEELWINNSDGRTHLLLLGTTGGGKTESLVSLVTNALCWASGFLYTDGKGDTSLWAKIYSLARRFGRDDDVLILNYMTGNSNAGGKSNTMNFLATGSFSVLTEVMTSLMDEGGGSGGDMWKGRAISLMTAMQLVGTELRDSGYLLYNVDILRKMLPLSQIIDLYFGKPVTMKTATAEVRVENYVLSERAKSSLNSYLESVPGFNWDLVAKGKPQSQTTMDQHGYLFMQFSRLLGTLADVYGYIFDTPLGDVDMEDVVVNNRILVVLLPALELSEEGISQLGKIVVSSLKSMMGKALGNEIEGERAIIIDAKITNSPSPFICVLDECGYYTVPGMAVMAAQARSLGFMLVFAAQDISAMKKRGGNIEKEVGAIIANCNIKSFLKLEDPGETWEMIKKAAGEALATKASGFSATFGLMTMNYFDMMNAAIEKMERVNFLDLKEQGPGEGHMTFMAELVRYNAFYADPPLVPVLRFNRMLRVRDPETVSQAVDELDVVLNNLRNPNWVAMRRDEWEALSTGRYQAPQMDIAIVSKALAMFGQARPVERSCAAIAGLAQFMQRHAAMFVQARMMDDAPVVETSTPPVEAGQIAAPTAQDAAMPMAMPPVPPVPAAPVPPVAEPVRPAPSAMPPGPLPAAASPPPIFEAACDTAGAIFEQQRQSGDLPVSGDWAGAEWPLPAPPEEATADYIKFAERAMSRAPESSEMQEVGDWGVPPLPPSEMTEDERKSAQALSGIERFVGAPEEAAEAHARQVLGMAKATHDLAYPEQPFPPAAGPAVLDIMADICNEFVSYLGPDGLPSDGGHAGAGELVTTDR